MEGISSGKLSQGVLASAICADYTELMNRRATINGRKSRARRGAATLDYVLVIAALLPIVLFVTVKGKRVMQLVWEMLCVLVSWPMM